MNVTHSHHMRVILLLCLICSLALSTPESAVSVKAQAGLLLSPSTNYPANLSPAFIGAGNINGDTAPDIFVTDGGLKYSILSNDGTGSFGSITTSNISVSSGRYSDLRDFNNDGKLDLVFIQNGLAPFGPHSIQVRLGNGTGGFAAPVTTEFGVANIGLVDFALADFNLDNRPDFAISTSGPGQSVPSGGVYLLYGNGSGG